MTFLIFVIYIGDLMAAFFGFAYLSFGSKILDKALENRWHRSSDIKTLRKRYKIMLERISKNVIHIVCLWGFTYQCYLCLAAYLQYESISATNLENKPTNGLPRFSVFKNLPGEYWEGVYRGPMNISIGRQIQLSQNFSNVIEKMLIRDGASGKARVLDNRAIS